MALYKLVRVDFLSRENLMFPLCTPCTAGIDSVSAPPLFYYTLVLIYLLFTN